MNSLGLLDRLNAVRRKTVDLCSPLTIEDHVIQSMPDVSPPKWHLAHTTWFFERIVLSPHRPGYRDFNPAFDGLFNSYYLGLGTPFDRSRRGHLSRPTVSEVLRYRQAVDDELLRWLSCAQPREIERAAPLVELGIQHEQQHQELLLTDIKHILWTNPTRPAYSDDPETEPRPQPATQGWLETHGGIHAIGHDGRGFAFDNEGPRHDVLLRDFRVSGAPVTNREWLEFMDDGGYANASLWLSEGWNKAVTQGWAAPLYWEKRGHGWWTMTFAGMRPVDGDAPVCHVSYFEADAFARWRGARLPTEAEWEVAFAGKRARNPVWEWTSSAYLPYPGYRPWEGAVGEYNGKFMCNQFVLRGGSIATPASHFRATYRNFFPPDARWQFSGVRLAKGASE